jgi:hypothetical protein
MNKRVCAFLVFALACLVYAIPAALADPHFSERDVKGPYGFAFDGFVAAAPTTPSTPTGSTLPVASVGRFTADGRGNITDGARTLVLGGNAVHQTFTCTYSVNADGTGHADCIVTGAPDEHFDFVIVDKGDQAYFTAVPPTVPGTGTTTIRGLAKRQR